MQTALSALEKWTKENEVTISICDSDKSKTVCCLYTKDPHELKGKLISNIYLSGIRIHHSTAPKFLGVHIYQSLTFKQQAEYTAKKAAECNKVLRTLSARTWGQRSRTLRTVHST